MTPSRKERRAIRSAKANFIRNDPDGRAMLDHAVIWLGTFSGFEGTTVAVREATVIELRSRDHCTFEAFEDEFGLPGIRLVDHIGRPLSLAELYAAKFRARLKGAFSDG